MAIKFGDKIENQNSDYTVVDALDNHVKGIVVPINGSTEEWSDTALAAVSADRRAKGVLGVDTANSKLYLFVGDLTIEDGTANGWGDADGSGWTELTNQSGSNTLNSADTADNDLTDGYYTTWSNSTTISEAIDNLNEVIGQIAPSPPATFATQKAAGGEFAPNDVFSFSTATARFISHTESGGSYTAFTPTANGTGETGSAGTSITIDTDADGTYSSTVDVAPSNDLENASYSFQYIGKFVGQSAHDLTATAAAASTTQETTTGNAGSGNNDIDITVTHGGFGTNDFHIGVNTITTATGTGNRAGGWQKFNLTSGSTTITRSLYVDPGYQTAAPSLTSGALLLDTIGTPDYLSGIPHFTSNTDFTIKYYGTLNPSGVHTYGANTSGGNNVVTFSAGSLISAPSAQTYQTAAASCGTTLTYDGSNAVTNSNVPSPLTIPSNNQATVANVSATAGVFGLYDIQTAGVGPEATVNSLHGNNSVDIVSANSFKLMFFESGEVSTSSVHYVVEDDIQSTVGTTNGERIKDPQVAAGTTGSYSDTPSEAQSNFTTTWSRQYGNNSSTSFAIDSVDAVTRAYGASVIRCAHDVNDYTTPNGPSDNARPASIENNNNFPAVPAALDLAADTDRGNTVAQVVTYRFKADSLDGDSVLRITYKGDLSSGSGTGEGLIKIFDGDETASLADANSSTGGWLDFFAGNTSATTSATGVPVGGCGKDGATMSKSSTNQQTIDITSGQGRWENGAAVSGSSYIYVRFVMYAGQYVERFALERIA